MIRFAGRLVLAIFGSAFVAAGPATAAKLIYSYDSASPLATKLTENGLTFTFEKTMLATRILRLMETQNVGAADLKPASQHDLGPGGLSAVIGRRAREHDLYEITAQEDGRALSRALCGNAARTWLAFGRLRSGQPLRVHALARDAGAARARLCVTLDYSFHGAWALPPADLPQPDRTDRFNNAPANRRY